MKRREPSGANLIASPICCGADRFGFSLACLAWAFVGVSGPSVEAQSAPSANERAAPTNAVLDNASIWRCCFVLRKPLVRIGGELTEVRPFSGSGVWVVAQPGKTYDPKVVTSETPAPPAAWVGIDFDDRSWTRMAGPFFPSGGWAHTKEVIDAGFCGYEGTNPNLAVICLRGKFSVADPATAGDLKLSLAYRGGVIVYLNGQEIARASIPESEKAKGMEALAEDYPKEAFVTEEGKVIRSTWGDPQKYFTQLQSRIRRLNDVVVPAKLLRKGVNVLAIEAHRAPYHEASNGKSGVAHYEGTQGFMLDWCTVGLPRVELAGTGEGVSSNRARPAGVQIWNQDSQRRVTPSEYGDPCEPLRPVRLIAARNGAFSGEVVVGSPAALRGLKAVAGDLTGPGTISAAGIQIRYALKDKDTDIPFDILAPDAPDEVAADKVAGGAVVPVWITVSVPSDAKAGDYRGTVTVSAEGVAPVNVPVELRVVDWRLPGAKDFVSHVGLTESPETVAMKYKVELWSPEHWNLLDKTLELMGQAGADDLFITAIRRTHHGNEHSMIRWVRRQNTEDGRGKTDDGGHGALNPALYSPDLSVAEKYLDLAIKHLGKVPVVCIYGWEPYTGSSYMGGPSSQPKGMLFTILDPATGKMEEAEGPKWGTPEVREFWKPVFDGMREILKKRGMEGSLMVGISGDSIPSKPAVEDLKAVAPDVRWVGQAHGKTSSLYGNPVGYYAEVWASPIPPDPADRRLYGWKNPGLRLSFPRVGSGLLIRTPSPLAHYRAASEEASTAGIRGFGRVGADFWDVLEIPNKTYGRGRNLIAHYPESDWGQLYLGNSTPYVLAPGARGPLATARFEMFREGARDMEARVFLEKALLDPDMRARLGEDLAGRCQQLLDERVRAILIGRTSLFFASGQERLEKFYELAAEAAAKLGTN